MEPLHIEWGHDLAIPSWYEPPNTLMIDRDYWDGLTHAERWELLVREGAHYLLAAVYPGRPRGAERSNAWRQEERGRRAALEFIVDDCAVALTAPRAVMEGRTIEPWELAERWGRSAAWCAERVRLWRLRYPGMAVLVGPV